MTKIGIGVAACAAIVLAIGVWQQVGANTRLKQELAALRTRPVAEVSSSAPSTSAARAVFVPDRATKELEDEILAAAEFAVPLTHEQKERVHLDTLIRKGELDGSHAGLFRQLRLPPETLDAFKTLLVERNQAIYDARELAKEEGLVIASVAEGNEINASAAAEIDSQIAALLGGDRYAQFREYLDLDHFHTSLAWTIASGQTMLQMPAEDSLIFGLARLHRAVDPDFPERVFQANRWPVDYPETFIEQAAVNFGADVARQLRNANEQNALRRRMGEMAREAALQGKLQLDENSASAYAAAQVQLENR